jgi:1,4-alpha-glucan branching enzyme
VIAEQIRNRQLSICNLQSEMSAGSFALILHAHLPFVRHPEHEEFLEEDWLFEAITETYVPLLQMMQRLLNDGVRFRLTMSLTPTLCAMLDDSLLRDRYVRHLERLIELAGCETARTAAEPQLAQLAHFYLNLFTETRRFFVDEWKSDLLQAFRALRATGALEIIGCAATHGLLPLLHQQSPASARAQVLIGRDEFLRCFGREPSGFWLPECAFVPGLEEVLQDANVRWFVLDAHGVMFGTPRPQRAVFAPYYTPAGPAALARDPDSSRQVWSAKEGYPGDPDYRDFYRDVGFDLPTDSLGKLAGGSRRFSGIKYYRVTGGKGEKELYDPVAADERAAQHAAHFFAEREKQIGGLAKEQFKPIIVAPFDAELFGHWWFEGPRFLEHFIRQAAASRMLSVETPSDFLAANATQQTMMPAASSWGEKGHLGVWLDPGNAWMYPHLHMAARQMSEAARAHREKPAPMTDRVLKQMARELLLAQASDWAFLIKNKTAPEYASQRVTTHLVRFNRLHAQLSTNAIDEKFLGDCEWRDNLFPQVNWRYYGDS